MSAGKNLKTARINAGLTQEELGARIGISGQYIGKLERNEAKNPSRDVIMRLGEMLGIPWEGLLYGTDAREGVSEQEILMARALRDIPPSYQLEVQATIVRGLMAAAQEKEQQAEREPDQTH